MAILLGAALVAYNAIINLAVPLGRWYTPVHVILAGVLVAVGFVMGLDLESLGLAPAAVWEGLRWGVVVVGATAVGLLVAAVLGADAPVVGGLLRDRRAAGLDNRRLAFESLVRIPLGTAVLEEVAFRGVLLGAFDAVMTTPAAVVASSVAFGLWHVGPTVPTVRVNEPSAGPRRIAVLVVGAVAATTLAGVGFALLRLGSGSLLAPIVAHWGFNALGLVAAVLVQRADSRGGEAQPS